MQWNSKSWIPKKKQLYKLRQIFFYILYINFTIIIFPENNNDKIIN